EDVVDQLEREAELCAEGRERGDGRRGRPGQDRPDRGAGRQQRSGLAGRHVEAFVQGDVLAVLEGDVLDLPSGQFAGDGGEEQRCAAGVRGGGFEQDLVSEGEERVAGQDRGGRPPDRPHGTPVAAFGVTVHQVVVQQREVVDEFDG